MSSYPAISLHINCPSCPTGKRASKTGQTVAQLPALVRCPCIFHIPSYICSCISKNMRFFSKFEFSSTPPYEKGYTYVERMTNGRLCYVRKRREPYKKQQKDYVEVYEEGKSEPHVHFHEHQHTHRHCHHQERPSPEELLVEIRREMDEEKRSPRDISIDCAMPLMPRIEERRPVHRSPSPTIEIREPRHVRIKYVVESEAIRYEGVPVEEVKVKKTHFGKHRIREVSPVREPDFDHRHVHHHFEPVTLSTREPRPYHIPEAPNAEWDENLGAWVVRRSPRVRFD